MHKIEPMNDRIVVKPLPVSDKTEGGLHIPGVAMQKAMEAKVLAVGPGRRLEDGCILPLMVKIDDHVVFNPHAGTEVKLNKEEVLILREDDILAVLRQEQSADVMNDALKDLLDGTAPIVEPMVEPPPSIPVIEDSAKNQDLEKQRL